MAHHCLHSLSNETRLAQWEMAPARTEMSQKYFSQKQSKLDANVLQKFLVQNHPPHCPEINGSASWDIFTAFVRVSISENPPPYQDATDSKRAKQGVTGEVSLHQEKFPGN